MHAITTSNYSRFLLENVPSQGITCPWQYGRMADTSLVGNASRAGTGYAIRVPDRP